MAAVCILLAVLHGTCDGLGPHPMFRVATLSTFLFSFSLSFVFEFSFSLFFLLLFQSFFLLYSAFSSFLSSVCFSLPFVSLIAMELMPVTNVLERNQRVSTTLSCAHARVCAFACARGIYEK